MTVIVLGNAALDTTLEVARLPRPGESILVDAVREDLGGKGLNQAVAVARAGVAVTYVAAVGDDFVAEAVRSRLTSEGIDTRGLRASPGLTDRTTVFVMRDAQNAIATSVAKAHTLEYEDVADIVGGLGPDDLLLMQGNLTLTTTTAAAAAAQLRGATVVLNPSPITWDYGDLWPDIDIAVVNSDECATLTGLSDPVAGARRLIDLGAATVVVTRGPRKALLVEAAEVASVDVPIVAAVDTTGAGDTFCGVFVAGVASGIPKREAMAHAAAAAAVSVTRPGAISSIPSRSELADLRPLKSAARFGT